MSEGAVCIGPPEEQPEPNGNGLDWRAPPKAFPPKGVVRSGFGMQIVNCAGAPYLRAKMDVQQEETMLRLGQGEKEIEASPGSKMRASSGSWHTMAGLGLEQEGKEAKAALPLSWDSGGLPAKRDGERCVERVAVPFSMGQERSLSNSAPIPDSFEKPGIKLKRGKFEIEEYPYRGPGLGGRIRTLKVHESKGKDAAAEPENEPSSSAAGLQEDSGFENEARAILKVEHLLANQYPGMLTSDQQAAEGSGRWGQEIGERGLESALERGLERGESLSRQEDGLGFALVREDSLKLFSSQYRGVVAQPHGKWGAQIYDKHVRLWLGTYDTEIDAARAHDRAAVKIKGIDAMTNFRPLTVADPEGAFIAGVGRDQVSPNTCSGLVTFTCSWFCVAEILPIASASTEVVTELCVLWLIALPTLYSLDLHLILSLADIGSYGLQNALRALKSAEMLALMTLKLLIIPLFSAKFVSC